MMRRDPTRIELKLDDIQEYELMKREMDNRKAKNGPFGKETTGNSPNNEESKNNIMDDKNSEETGKNRTEAIHRRIGYDPNPRMS
jgi:anaphase-promoting complex subunit 12